MSPNPDDQSIPQALGSPSITLVLTVILLFTFFVGFFSVFFCRCFMDTIIRTWNLHRTPSINDTTNNSANRNGLDPSTIELFPTFIYSSVKEFRQDKHDLECAICISEFEDDDMLRLLEGCNHVFHKDCIDNWLQNHKTCPVCRRDLDSPKETTDRPATPRNGSMQVENNNDAVIDIREDDGHSEEDRPGDGISEANERVKKKQLEMDTEILEPFGRNRSTGHSIPDPGQDQSLDTKFFQRKSPDKHTLRLMDNARVKFIRGNSTPESCITFGRNYPSPIGTPGELSRCSSAAPSPIINRVQ